MTATSAPTARTRSTRPGRQQAVLDPTAQPNYRPDPQRADHGRRQPVDPGPLRDDRARTSSASTSSRRQPTDHRHRVRRRRAPEEQRHPLAGVPLTDITLVDAPTRRSPARRPVLLRRGRRRRSGGHHVDRVRHDAARASRSSTSRPARTRSKVTYPTAGWQPQDQHDAVIVDADGATLALTGGIAGGSGRDGRLTDPTFATDIYPRLQKAAAGGLGCANCHTAAGPRRVLPYDDTAGVTLANIKAIAGVINLTTPGDSLFLTNPLYEPTPPQNHPNATFLDINDPDYKLFLLWITNGAKP